MPCMRPVTHLAGISGTKTESVFVPETGARCVTGGGAGWDRSNIVADRHGIPRPTPFARDGKLPLRHFARLEEQS